MSDLNCIDPKQLAVVATAIALAIADDKSADELNVLGNLIVAVGSLLLTIAAQQQSLQALLEAQAKASTKEESKSNNKT